MMINPNTDKSLQEVFELYFDYFSTIFHCIKVGKIISFDKTTQTCKVEILHKRKNEFVTSRNELLNYSELGDVPVVIMGGGSSYITHPISAGDTCLLLFNDYQLTGWKHTGNAEQSTVDRKHDISDAIAIVGLNALPNAIQNYSDYLDLHYSDNSSIIVGNTIEVNNATINLNGNTNVTGDETVSGVITAPTLNATSAANGTFVSADNKTITVVNGIVTSIA